MYSRDEESEHALERLNNEYARVSALFLAPNKDVIEAVSALSSRFRRRPRRSEATRTVANRNVAGDEGCGGGPRMVLLTNTAEKRARIALQCLGLSEFFDTVYGAGTLTRTHFYFNELSSSSFRL